MKKFDPCWSEVGVWGNVTCPELQKVTHCRNCQVYTQAALLCLDRDSVDGSDDEWAEHYAKPKKQTSASSVRLMIFRIGAEWLGIPGGIMQEVASLRPIHSLPHRRDPAVLGIVNIRGELLVAVSIGEALGIEKEGAQVVRPRATSQRMLVIAREKRRFVFPVDEVFGLVQQDSTAIQKNPGTLSGSGRPVTKGILVWEKRAVACLDGDALFHLLQRRML